MQATFPGTDRQPQATIGNRSQMELAIMGVISDLQRLPLDVLQRSSFNGVLSEAARFSGLDDQDIADQIHVCKGYMSRFMRGVAQQWAKRLVLFMRVTRSLGPLQWMAEQMGCDVVQRDMRAAEVAALRQRLQDLEKAA